MPTPLLSQVEAMGRYVKPHIIGKRAGFDLFPRTVKGVLISSHEPKNALDQFPITNGAGFCLFTVTGQYPDIKMEQSCQSVQNGCQQPQPMKLRNADKMSVCGY
jgi:hypothetical protein